MIIQRADTPVEGVRNMPAVEVPASAVVAECTVDDRVDTALLLKNPLDALLPILQNVSGWEEVRSQIHGENAI